MRNLTLKILSSIVTKSKPINPYTHQQLPQKSYIDESQLFDTIKKTSDAYEEWKFLNLQERINRVTQFSESILNEKDAIRQNITKFTGKSYKNIDYQYSKINQQYLPLIQNSKKILIPQTFQSTFNNKRYSNKIIKEPVGISLIFPYFSQPIFDTLIHLIPCLISGNGALLKVSDFNHFVGTYFQQKAKQHLRVQNIVSDLFFHPTQLTRIRQFRAIKKVIYSGSQSSARKIFQNLVQTRFIDCNLFYGGQDCAYVDSSANLQEAAQQICLNSFYNNGQSYDCIKRLYLHQSIADNFLQILQHKTNELIQGDPQDVNTDLGPIMIPENALKFEQLINDAINSDAQCLTGGMMETDGKQKGIFCEPTILINCNSNMQIVQQQLQAPVLCVETVNNFQEFANESAENKYGTGIRIFTKNTNQYEKFIQQSEVGYISFNDGSITNCDLPIEGWRKSGKGKMLSELSYQEYVVPKTLIREL